MKDVYGTSRRHVLLPGPGSLSPPPLPCTLLMASGVKEWDFPGSFIEYFLCFQFSFNSKCVFCLIYVSDGRNETLKATLFLVVADVRDPRILDLMILTPMILAPSRCRRAWQRDGQSLEGEILQKVFFCDGALGSIL